MDLPEEPALDYLAAKTNELRGSKIATSTPEEFSELIKTDIVVHWCSGPTPSQ